MLPEQPFLIGGKEDRSNLHCDDRSCNSACLFRVFCRNMEIEIAFQQNFA